MKYIYLIFAILGFYSTYAQELELVENTWYLRTIQSNDMAPVYNVAEMNPPIAPYLIISEDLSFNGEGACKTFSGTFSYHPYVLTTTEFDATTDDCGVEEQNGLENSYFGLISLEFEYEISDDGEGAVLTMGTPLGGSAIFKSYSLATNDFYKNGLSVYPNPASDMLHIEVDRELDNSAVTILTMEGKRIIVHKAAFENTMSINVSNLSNGVYFLNIEDKYGNTTTSTFIKK